MAQLVRIGVLAFALMLVSSDLFAQTSESARYTGIGAGLAAIGAGLVALAGGLGIGRLAASALESIARQPEVRGPIGVNMIIAAALIEGFVFFGIFVCWTVVRNSLAG